ncbi:MAG: DUF1461 domain-containing protein [Candidatus Woesearchaeota archaeon]
MNYRKLSSWFATALLPLLFYLLSILVVVYSEHFHQKEFEKLGIPQNLRELDGKILSYFATGDEKVIEKTGLREAEKSHLADVRKLVKDAEKIFAVLLLFWLLVFYTSNERKNALFVGSLLIISIPLILAAIPFDSLFVAFHLITFPQGGWLFPPGWVLTQVYPVAFFRDAAISIALHGAIFGIVLMFFSKFGDENFNA